MEKPLHKNLAFCLFTFTFLPAMLFQAGCKYGGLAGIFGTEGHHEKKIPAEYDLAENTEKKILVLVEQPGWLDAQVNLRYYLTKIVRQDLMVKVKIPPENLIAYSTLSEFRASEPDFSMLSPFDIGEALDADMVLLIAVEDYQLREMAEMGYYTGILNTRAVLFDTESAKKLWPRAEQSKSVKVGYEVEVGGLEVAVSRLVAASAYCTTRYFYDCPKAKFRIAEDRAGIGWEGWK